MKPPDQIAAAYKRAEEGDAYKVIETAGEAEAVLKFPAFQRAVEKIKDRIWKEFKAAGSNDAAALIRARMRLDIVEEVIYELTDQKRRGEEAQKELSLIEKARERIRKFGYIDR